MWQRKELGKAVAVAGVSFCPTHRALRHEGQQEMVPAKGKGVALSCLCVGHPGCRMGEWHLLTEGSCARQEAAVSHQLLVLTCPAQLGKGGFGQGSNSSPYE